MSSPRPSAVILDFDETLADSSAGRLWAMQLTVQRHLERAFSADEACDIVHRFSNLEAQMEYLAAGTDLVLPMIRSFREHYYGPERIPPSFYPGMLEALEELVRRDIRLAVVTSRYRYAEEDGLVWGVMPELERLGVADLFSAMVGYEDTIEHKPSAAPFLECIKLLGVEAASVIAIGDSPLDIRGARNAGVGLAVAALWGTLTPEPLLAELPDATLEQPSEMLDLVLAR